MSTYAACFQASIAAVLKHVEQAHYVAGSNIHGRSTNVLGTLARQNQRSKDSGDWEVQVSLSYSITLRV